MKYAREARRLQGLLHQLGYTQSGIAQELGRAERTIREYCSGRVRIPLSLFLAIEMLGERKG